MTAMEVKKVNTVTLVDTTIRDNTKCELNFVSILNLHSNTAITGKIFIDIILDQMAKPTASLLSNFIKIRLNHGLDKRILIATTKGEPVDICLQKWIKTKVPLMLGHNHKVRTLLPISVLYF